MDDAVPVYLIGSPDGRLADVARVLGEGAERIPPGRGATTLRDRPPGVAIVDSDGMSVGELLAMLDTLASGPWILAVVGTGDPPHLRTLSLGGRDGVEDVRRYLAAPATEPGCLLTLDGALAQIARVRHDVNNPLTAAMAETQLMLMDVSDGEGRESLDAILQQLRRIRDMLTASRHLRPRRD